MSKNGLQTMTMEMLEQWGLLQEQQAGRGDPVGACHLSRHSGHVLPIDKYIHCLRMVWSVM